ncbi:glycosyltransferase family 4 protein [Candidatus Uhrbacteria bacterium]|nr:glycosyltransferase family 4 protein [Candidatus Uhrbacteria bacterium]
MKTVGIDLRCLPTDGSAGAGVAHAAGFLTEALLAQRVAWEWRPYTPTTATGASLRAAMKARPCDFLFVPSGAVAPLLWIPALPWVHDLAIFDHPEWFPQSFFRRAITTTLFLRGIRRAPHVFAVSEHTKREIVRVCGVDPKRILVTYEGGDPLLAAMRFEDLEQKKREARDRIRASGIVSPFVLALGTVEPRKNLSMLVEMRLPIDLVIAGADGWKMNALPSRTGVHRITDVSDELRRDVLLAAEVVAVPSLHEGFGLVALEAMQAGTAVIASNAGALPEVIGDGGMLLDPNDRDGWERAINGLLKDPHALDKSAKKGKERSRVFSWQRTARIVTDAIASLVF